MENEPYRLLKQQVAELTERTDRTIAEFSKKLSEVERLTNDTNREAHITKHDVQNIKDNWAAFVELLEKRDARDEEVRKTVKEIREDLLYSSHEKVVGSKWISEMQTVATIDDWKRIKAEVEINTQFRTRLNSIGWVVGGLLSFFAVVAAIAGFFKWIFAIPGTL